MEAIDECTDICILKPGDFSYVAKPTTWWLGFDSSIESVDITPDKVILIIEQAKMSKYFVILVGEKVGEIVKDRLVKF